MQENERRQIIISYIKKNLGCKAEDIVEGVKDKISRRPVFDILKILVSEGVIKDEKTNRRDHRYFPNTENESLIVKNELMDFKDKFFALLEKTQQYLVLLNSTKESHSIKNLKNSKKNSIRDPIDDYIHHYDKSIRIYQVRSELIYSLIESNKIYYDMLLKYKTYPEIKFDNAESKFSEPAIKKLDERNKANLLKITEITKLYSANIKKAGYLPLVVWPIFIFMTLVYLCNLKSLIKWQRITKDKEIIFNLNKLVFEDILEINKKLIDFISTNVTFGKSHEIIESMFGKIQVDSNNQYTQMFTDYSIFNMKNEIRDVINSLSKIKNQEIIFEEEEDLEIIKEIPQKMLYMLNIK